MKENINELKNTLISLSLNDKDSSHYSDNELFHVLLKEESFGPVRGNDINDLISRGAKLDENILVKSVNQKKWLRLFDHPFFQRRQEEEKKNHQVSEKAKSNKFYLLNYGQKTGPFSTAQLQEKLENREIDITHMISSDNGTTWERILELDSFDRRKLGIGQELPPKPTSDIFKGVEDEVAKDLKNANKNKTTDTIASLAHLGNLESKKHHASVLKNNIRNFSTSRKIPMIASALCICVLIIVLPMMIDFSPPSIQTPPLKTVRGSLNVTLQERTQNMNQPKVRSSIPPPPPPKKAKASTQMDILRQKKNPPRPLEQSLNRNNRQNNDDTRNRRNSYRNSDLRDLPEDFDDESSRSALRQRMRERMRQRMMRQRQRQSGRLREIEDDFYDDEELDDIQPEIPPYN